MVKLLRAVWNKLLPGFPNPLKNVPLRVEDTHFRKPYSEEQLLRILDVDRGKFIHPIIVTGICTAMREGDCCCLRWDSLDLENNFISTKSAKTGSRVEIPIWALLREVLVGKFGERRSTYVFPDQAEMYLKNPTGITWRVRKILEGAGIGGETDTTDDTEKGQRLRHTTGYDFHSFRVTWITMALSQGIPIELVRRVTGHATVETVLKHYFKPDRENFRRVLESKMPTFLAGGPKEKLPAQGAIKQLRELSRQWATLMETLTEENFPTKTEQMEGLLKCMQKMI
jgi:integrase